MATTKIQRHNIVDNCADFKGTYRLNFKGVNC